MGHPPGFARTVGRRRALHLLAGAALGGVVAACGGGDDTESNPTPTARTAEATGPAAMSTSSPTLAALASPSPQATRTPSPVTAAATPPIPAAATAAVTQYIADAKAPGVALAVAYRSSAGGRPAIEYFNAGAISRAPSAAPVTSSSIFEIGSLSKLFAGIVLAAYVEQGTVAVTAPLQRFVPAGTTVPVFQGTPIVLEQLATHTAGFPKNPTATDTLFNGSDPVPGHFPEPQLLSYLSDFQLSRAPGSKFLYSNYGFALLGMAEEQIAGDGWANIVVKEVCDPLGLDDTRVVLSAEQQQRLVTGYLGPAKPGAAFATTGGYLAAGALRSTARDLGAFLIANMQTAGTPIRPALDNAKQQHSAVGPAANETMGLAWQLRSLGQPNAQLWKDGSTDGCSSYIWFMRDGTRGFVLLANQLGAQDLAAQLIPIFAAGG